MGFGLFDYLSSLAFNIEVLLCCLFVTDIDADFVSVAAAEFVLGYAAFGFEVNCISWWGKFYADSLVKDFFNVYGLDRS